MINWVKMDDWTHKFSDRYCNATIMGHHLPFWGMVQVLQMKVCNRMELDDRTGR